MPFLYFLRGDKQKGLEAIEASIEQQKKPFDKSTIPKFSSAFTEVMTIVGNEFGTVDPEFLKFVEKYKAL